MIFRLLLWGHPRQMIQLVDKVAKEDLTDEQRELIGDILAVAWWVGIEVGLVIAATIMFLVWVIR